MIRTFVCVILVMTVLSSGAKVTAVKAISTVKDSVVRKYASATEIKVSEGKTKTMQRSSRQYNGRFACTNGRQRYFIAYNGKSRIILRINQQWQSAKYNPYYGHAHVSGHYCLKTGDVVTFEAHRWDNNYGVAAIIQKSWNRRPTFVTDASNWYGFKAKEYSHGTRGFDMTSRGTACRWNNPVYPAQPPYPGTVYTARYVWAKNRPNGTKPDKILLRKKIGPESC